MTQRYRTYQCVWCGVVKQIRGRGMCGSCYGKHRHEVPTVLEYRLALIRELREQHLSPREIAGRLEMHQRTVERHLNRMGM